MTRRVDLAFKIREFVQGFLETAEDFEWEPDLEELSPIVEEELHYLRHTMGEDEWQQLLQNMHDNRSDDWIEPFIQQWLQGPTRSAMIRCRLPIRSALQHLLSMSDAIEMEPPRIYVAVTLARVVAELCARLWWLADPSIDWVERIRRYVNDCLLDLQDVSRVGLRKKGDPERNRQLVEERREEFLQIARSVGYVGEPQRGRRSAFVGTAPPSSSELLGMVREGSRHFYALSSANLHGRGYALGHFDYGFLNQSAEQLDEGLGEKRLASDLHAMVAILTEGLVSFFILNAWPKDRFFNPLIEFMVILAEMEGIDLAAEDSTEDTEDVPLHDDP